MKKQIYIIEEKQDEGSRDIHETELLRSVK